MKIRKYTASDCEALLKLFYETVHAVNSRDYTEEQLDAWAPADTDQASLIHWDRSFSEHYTLVAVEGTEIVGFGDIDETGYLDRLFVHRDHQGKGVATALCDALEQTVPDGKISTAASITARLFFEGRGYRVVRQQQVIRRNVPLTNYIMTKISR